jgi:hypothetical protein
MSIQFNEGVIKLPKILLDASYQIVDFIGDNIVSPLTNTKILQELNSEFNSLLNPDIISTIKLLIETGGETRNKLPMMDEIFNKHKIKIYSYLPDMEYTVSPFDTIESKHIKSHIIIKKNVLEIFYTSFNEIKVFYSNDVIDLIENYDIPHIEIFKSGTLKVTDLLMVESEINMNIMSKISSELKAQIKFKFAQLPQMSDDNFRGRITWYKADGESRSTLEIPYYHIDGLIKKFTKADTRNEIIQVIQHELIHYFDYVNSQKDKSQFNVTNVIFERQQWILDTSMIKNSQTLSNMKAVFYYTSDHEMQSFSHNFANAIINHYISGKKPTQNQLIIIIEKLQRNFTNEMERLSRISKLDDLVDGIGTYLTISKLPNYKIPVYNRNDFMRDGTKTRKTKIIHGDKIWNKLRGYIIERLNDRIESLKSDQHYIEKYNKVNPKPQIHDGGNTQSSTVELNSKIKI